MAPAVNVGRPHAARRRWPAVLVLLLLVVPILEVVVIISVGRVIGGWPTFLLLLAESALGAWLVRREGARTWQALSEALSTGRMPSRQLADAALVLVGGTLLLAPGFLTDVVGFVVILPLTRPLARRVLEGVVARRLLGSVVAPGGFGGFGGPGFPGPGFPGTGSPRPSGHPGPGTPRDRPDDVIEGEIL